MVEFDSAWKLISKDWNKTLKFVAIVGLLSLVPIIGSLISMGLMIKIISNAINKKDEIPEVFQDLGDTLIEGLKITLFFLVICIPVIIVLFLTMGGAMTALMTGDADAAVNAIMAVAFSIIPILLIIGLVYALILPALIGNYAKEKTFSAFLSFKKAFNIVFKNLGAWLKMIVISLVYSIPITLIGSIIPIIGTLLAAALVTITSGKILGEWYAEVA